MPFPSKVRREALVRSDRSCCVCKHMAGRDAEVHHIVQEADGGSNTLENAIVLCSRCHGEAGHYNPRHPRGSKYSPSELREHRDRWWSYCAAPGPHNAPDGYREPPGSARGGGYVERRTGVLWSRRADISAAPLAVQFRGRFIASHREENQSQVSETELFSVGESSFLVYEVSTHRADWAVGTLHGAGIQDDSPFTTPLNREDLFDHFAALAATSGLIRVRRMEF